ncbi:hypothetical protein [Streptosporangium longisporum]|uniref:hypothetical protein n=1 Tax=Streptosporangium longisporum TaxID=46187 RepID=UPI0031E8DCA5
MGPSIDIPAISKEFLKTGVGGSPDLPSFPVWVALLPVGQDPGPSDWVKAEWIVESGVNKAAVLVGAGTDLPLTKGLLHQVWVLIIAAPEEPVLKPGTVYAS